MLTSYIPAMADDDLWFAPLLKTARVVPREPEPLWEVRSLDHHTWSALLRYHGEWGVEAQINRDGNFVIGWRFNTRVEAVQWAEAERHSLTDSRVNLRGVVSGSRREPGPSRSLVASALHPRARPLTCGERRRE